MFGSCRSGKIGMGRGIKVSREEKKSWFPMAEDFGALGRMAKRAEAVISRGIFYFVL